MSWEITLKKDNTIISDDLATGLRIAKVDFPNRIRALEKILKLYSNDLTIASIQQECAIIKDALERLQKDLEGFN